MGKINWKNKKHIGISFVLGICLLLILNGLVSAWLNSSYETAENEAYVWFEVLGEQPFLMVISTYPQDNEEHVPVDSDIAINFDREIAQGTEFGSISMEKVQDNSPVLINSKSIDGYALNIEPDTLAYGTTYDVTVPVNSVTALSDNTITLESDFIFSFTTSFQIGDVVGNGQVDVGDAIAVLRHIVDIINIEDSYGSEALIRADVDGDGNVDVSDALLILRYIVGIITEFPVDS